MKYLFILAFTCLFVSSPNDNIRTNYPTPEKTGERLFFIQRNINQNTIVYDANFDKDGNLNEQAPIDVYWIRFEERGQKMDLRNLERTLAYGIECTKSNNYKNKYKVKIVADKSRELLLEQVAPYKAHVYLKIDNKTSQLDHMYIDADNSGIWPDLKYIELFGKDTATGDKTYEKVFYCN